MLVNIHFDHTWKPSLRDFRLKDLLLHFFPQYRHKLLGSSLWKFTRLSGGFPPFVGHFFERARERGVNYITSFTKLDWSVIFSSRSRYGSYENEYLRPSNKANIWELHVSTPYGFLVQQSHNNSSNQISTQLIHLKYFWTWGKFSNFFDLFFLLTIRGQRTRRGGRGLTFRRNLAVAWIVRGSLRWRRTTFWYISISLAGCSKMLSNKTVTTQTWPSCFRSCVLT